MVGGLTACNPPSPDWCDLTIDQGVEVITFDADTFCQDSTITVADDAQLVVVTGEHTLHDVTIDATTMTSGGSVVIEGNLTDSAISGFTADIAVTDSTFSNVNISDSYGRLTVERSTLTGGQINTVQSWNMDIADSTFTNNPVNFWDSSGSITASEFTGYWDGPAVTAGGHFTITGSNFHHNSQGIKISGWDPSSITIDGGTEFRHNGIGVLEAGSGSSVNSSQILDAEFTQNGIGIRLLGGSGNLTVDGATINANRASGIDGTPSVSVTVTNSTLNGNGWDADAWAWQDLNGRRSDSAIMLDLTNGQQFGGPADVTITSNTMTGNAGWAADVYDIAPGSTAVASLNATGSNGAGDCSWTPGNTC